MKRLRFIIPMVLVFLVIVTTSTQSNERQKGQTNEAIEFVKLGYGDVFDKDFRSLKFVTDCMKTDQIIKIIPVIKEYNEFQDQKVADALKQYRGLMNCVKKNIFGAIHFILIDQKECN